MVSLIETKKIKEHMLHQKRKRSWESGSSFAFEGEPFVITRDCSVIKTQSMTYPSRCRCRVDLKKAKRVYPTLCCRKMDCSSSKSLISMSLKILGCMVLVLSRSAVQVDAYNTNKLRKLIYYIPESLITIFGPPYERDVSPSPMSLPTLSPTKSPVQWLNPPFTPTRTPVAPSTSSPTRAPTLTPTRKPTQNPTDKPTKYPTFRPTPNPTVRPTSRPSPRPTLSPTFKPTSAPTISQPSDVPSSPPSQMPQNDSTDSTPTAVPSLFNSTTPAPQVAITKAPVMKTSNPSRSPSKKAPSKSPESNIFDRTPAPQPAVAPETQFVDVSAPIDFEVDAIIQSGNQTLDRISEIWAESIRNYYVDVYSGQSNVKVQDTKLETVAINNNQRTRSIRLRALQEGNRVRLQSTGESNFEVDELSRDPWDFSADAGQQLNSFLTTENLQQALRDSNYGGAVLVSEVQSNVKPQDRNAKEPPTNAEIVIGFTLLVMVIASLVFWANVLWKKRQKKLRARRMEAARKANSITFSPPPQRGQVHRSAPRNESAVPMMGLKHTISSDSSLSSYYGIESKSDTGRDNLLNTQVADEPDPFAEELKRAVSLDRAAWDEFLRKKKLLEDEERAFAAATTSSDGIKSTVASVGQANPSNLAVFSAPGSQDLGMEVAMNLSFPYGDERHNTSKLPMRLTSENAVELTDAGISRGIKSNEANKLSNNDQGRTEKSLMESWDLNENPVKDENGPSQFSFLYPLKRRKLSDEVPEGQLSPDDDSDDSPSSAAVRGSPEVTSIDSATNGSYSQANLKDVRQYEEELDDIDDEAESRITASMLKEVENITKYLQLYEKTKKESRLAKERQLIERSRQLSSSLESQASANVPYEPFHSMTTSREVEKSQFSVPKTASISSDRSYEQEGVDNDDDEDSRRLGISRYVVEKPTVPLLWYRDENHYDGDDNSVTSPSRTDLVDDSSCPLSPIPYSDSFRQEPGFDDEVKASSSRPDIAVTTTTRSTPKTSSEPEPSQSNNNHHRSSPVAAPRPSLEPQVATKPRGGFLSSLRKGQSVFDDSAPFDEKMSMARAAARAPVVSPPSSSAAMAQSTKEPMISPRVKKTSKTFQSLFSMFESKPMKPIIPPNDTWQYSGTGRNKEKKKSRYFGFTSSD